MLVIKRPNDRHQPRARNWFDPGESRWRVGCMPWLGGTSLVSVAFGAYENLCTCVFCRP
jgi:hypothetical protein